MPRSAVTVLPGFPHSLDAMSNVARTKRKEKHVSPSFFMVLRATHVRVFSTFAVLNRVKEMVMNGSSRPKSIYSSITVVLGLDWQAFALRRLPPVHS